jgi:hypothetical protein
MAAAIPAGALVVRALSVAHGFTANWLANWFSRSSVTCNAPSGGGPDRAGAGDLADRRTARELEIGEIDLVGAAQSGDSKRSPD